MSGVPVLVDGRLGKMRYSYEITLIWSLVQTFNAQVYQNDKKEVTNTEIQHKTKYHCYYYFQKILVCYRKNVTLELITLSSAHEQDSCDRPLPM